MGSYIGGCKDWLRDCFDWMSVSFEARIILKMVELTAVWTRVL